MIDGPRARIRLDALQHNLELIRTRAPDSRVMAAIKANAYGHGLVPIARALADVDCLAVARLREAQALRNAGVNTPIALLGGVVDASGLDLAAELDCTVVVHTAPEVALIESGARAFERVWLKVDTGMRRLGVTPEEAPGLIARLGASGNVSQLGLMTHMANADEPDDPMTDAQLERFWNLTRSFDGDLSVANSALALSRAADLSDVIDVGRLWVRPGISLYGVSPFRNLEVPELRPVMQLETELVAVKSIAAGDAVGYGGTWRAPCDTLLGIAAVGYGDGYSRHLPSDTPVLVNGRRARVAGRVSMDLLAIDLSRDASDQIGDPVVLWGDELPIEEVSRHAQTIPYTLLTGVTERVPRVYE